MPSTQTPWEELLSAFIRHGGQAWVACASFRLPPSQAAYKSPEVSGFSFSRCFFWGPCGGGGRRSITHRGLAQNTAPGQPPKSPRTGPAAPSHHPFPPPVPPLPSFPARISAQGWTPKSPILWMRVGGVPPPPSAPASPLGQVGCQVGGMSGRRPRERGVGSP